MARTAFNECHGSGCRKGWPLDLHVILARCRTSKCPSRALVILSAQADMRAEKVIQAELQKARPAFGFLMEESGEGQRR